MMAIAIIFAISFLAPNNRTFIAFIGGCGFGWFIDELGKFITRDVNYFFQPTIALIYFVFIAMYLVFRGIERRELSPDEAVLNGLEALKAAAIGELERDRAAPRRCRSSTQTGADDPFARQVHALLADETGLPDPNPTRFEQWGRSVRAWYLRLTQKRWFERVVVWWFVIVGSGQLVAAVLLSVDHNAIRGFEEWAIVISSGVSGALIVVGVVRLPPPPADGVPLVRTRHPRADLRDPGVRVRARAARRRVRPRVQPPDLGGDPFDDPRRGRANALRLAESSVSGATAPRGTASGREPSQPRMTRAGEAEPRRARGQVGGPLGRRRHVHLRPRRRRATRSTRSTRRRRP